jgi:hypothetical protein
MYGRGRTQYLRQQFCNVHNTSPTRGSLPRNNVRVDSTNLRIGDEAMFDLEIL